ncbi:MULTISPECIES: cysteine desulfurase family protein [Microbacterium]|uniref:Cysteine desulfurase NifS n=1 Tax=Microbacterium hominis TaxID=162426 RepID=A0A2K9DJL1_9MICO|nr:MULTISPECIES: cysteine desulfurase family protein [Microbacterium]AUG29687.1 cysteine desulfurase NifS [Microbacterium hominis]
MSIYFDHAASAPLRDSARDAWISASALVGNASSVHGAGQAARRLLEGSRERIAAVLDCDPIEVVLTSGGTESVNLALKGLWWARPADTGAIVLPDGEHHATLDAVGWLRSQGAAVRPVGLDDVGRIRQEDFRDALTAPEPAAVATALVANNEVGTVQDAAALAGAAAAAGVALHLDAVGALGHVPVSFSAWRADASGAGGLVALSISGHKVGAPVGTGALVVSRHARLSPLVHGGGQQRGLRSGTPDVAGASALAVALEEAESERVEETARLRRLGDRLVAGIRAAVPEAELLGDANHRIAGNVHVHLPGAAGESMLFLLDQAGISVSTGSACQAGVAEPSHVVLALGRDERVARSVLRLTLGRTSTEADVDALLSALPGAYARATGAGRLRSAGAAVPGRS